MKQKREVSREEYLKLYRQYLKENSLVDNKVSRMCFKYSSNLRVMREREGAEVEGDRESKKNCSNL